jgi:hypothetical protein
MSLATLDDILDDLFLGCALEAFLAIAKTTGQIPDPEASRQLAYQLYEEALANRASRRSEPELEARRG